MSTPADTFATPYVTAGALFVEAGHVLLVRKTYGDPWDIPGGFAERGESPAAACRRELREELGLDRVPRRLLVQDWAPTQADGDKILYLFSCGELGADAERITLDGTELSGWDWVPVGQLVGYVTPRLARRVGRAYEAHTTGTSFYLEHGEPVLPE